MIWRDAGIGILADPPIDSVSGDHLPARDESRKRRHDTLSLVHAMGIESGGSAVGASHVERLLLVNAGARQAGFSHAATPRAWRMVGCVGTCPAFSRQRPMSRAHAWSAAKAAVC